MTLVRKLWMSFYRNWAWNSWMAGVWSNPCLWANVGLPAILFMVCIRCSVGAWSVVHPNVVAMVKSRRLDGSAMFALLGTRLSIWVSCWRLCQAQCDPMRLLSGWCLPDPLLIACVAGSLSHSCMYGCVSSGWTRTGVTMAAQASKKYMYARLLVKCFRIFRGTTPWMTILELGLVGKPLLPIRLCSRSRSWVRGHLLWSRCFSMSVVRRRRRHPCK